MLLIAADDDFYSVFFFSVHTNLLLFSAYDFCTLAKPPQTHTDTHSDNASHTTTFAGVNSRSLFAALQPSPPCASSPLSSHHNEDKVHLQRRRRRLETQKSADHVHPQRRLCGGSQQGAAL